MNSEFTGNMTVISKKAFNAATTLNMNAEEAKTILLSIPARSFPETLQRLAPEKASQQIIEDALCSNDPSRKREAMRKKVRNWFNEVNYPTKREDLFELCFILKLSLQNADTLLTTFGDEGIHWRNPHEIIYAYALQKRMDYREVVLLEQSILSEGIWTENPEMTDSFTNLLRDEVPQIETEDELRKFICDSAANLGALHNNAYKYFNQMLKTLETPQSSVTEEDDYPVSQIVNTYFNRLMVDNNNITSKDRKRKDILSRWPDDTTISKVKSRKTDVSRKLLLLFFLATDGGEEIADRLRAEEFDDDDNDENDADEDFRSSYIRMNQMMAACGYRMLDPRNPMDWIAIYCMRVTDDPEDMRGLDERLEEMMKVLFAPD